MHHHKDKTRRDKKEGKEKKRANRVMAVEWKTERMGAFCYRIQKRTIERTVKQGPGQGQGKGTTHHKGKDKDKDKDKHKDKHKDKKDRDRGKHNDRAYVQEVFYYLSLSIEESYL
jgi:hypothetical protein